MAHTNSYSRPNRYAGRCRSCNGWVAESAGFLGGSKAEGWHVVCTNCANGVPAVPTTVEHKSFPLTEEQEAIVAAFNEGINIVVQAGAGTGKTSTLVAIAQSTSRRGQYLAFNRNIVLESAAKFRAVAPHVNASTIHSVAFRTVGKHHAFKFARGVRRHSTFQVAEFLGIEGDLGIENGEVHIFKPKAQASFVIEALKSFCQSADETPNVRHFPYVDGIDTPDVQGRRTYEHNRQLAAHLISYLVRLWDDVSDVNGHLRLGKSIHSDVYLKVWANGDAEIPADFILVDEAQDLNPVMLQILDKQTAQLVVVGDSQQAIYGWRGAIDALDRVKVESTLFLTHSFRFGPEIADVANQILATIEDARLRIVGRGPAGVVKAISSPDAVLTRSNGGALTALLAALETDAKVYLVGAEKGELQQLCRAAQDIQSGRGTDHPDLAQFNSWGEVKEFAEHDPAGGEIKIFVQLIDRYGAQVLISALERATDPTDADLVISTAHKSKGCQWNRIQLAGDFGARIENINDASDEEKRLLYVAVTRAQEALDVTQCAPVAKLIGTWDGASEDEDDELEYVD